LMVIDMANSRLKILDSLTKEEEEAILCAVCSG